MRRFGSQHPSPNSGRCEAAFAGALDVRLGGLNVYADREEFRPLLGDGAPPTHRDIARANRLSGAVGIAAAMASAGLAVARTRTRSDR